MIVRITTISDHMNIMGTNANRIAFVVISEHFFRNGFINKHPKNAPSVLSNISVGSKPPKPEKS